MQPNHERNSIEGTSVPATMKSLLVISACTLFFLCSQRVSSENVTKTSGLRRASFPPRGWNSYDSFSWTISEEEFLESAEIISQRLKDHGYEYVVVDCLWYRKKVKGAYPDSLGLDVIDEWGRMIPDPGRWPSSKVKHDCVFGDDLDLNEIGYVSEILKELDHPIIYSLSPGTSVTSAMAKDVSEQVNMYRITGDDWDRWGDVKAHFNVTRDFASANMIGAEGLMGKSWPDLDMLPFGWLTDPGSNQGPHRFSDLSLDEQKTQMTLWSMAKSPLMYGGDVRKLDETTYDLITNPTLLEINFFSSDNMEFPYITSPNNFKNDAKYLIGKKRRSKRDRRTSFTHSLGLIRCNESKASGWYIEGLDRDIQRICRKRSPGNKQQVPFCVHKRDFGRALDEDTIYQEDYGGKHHLVAINRMKFCLDGSPKRKLTSREVNLGTFSPCRRDANQIWELNLNGTLVNSYSGLCATLDSVKARENFGGLHSWVATGREGQIYVAFFNLNEEKTMISMELSDLVKVLPGTDFSSCKCKEVWSGKDIVIVEGKLSLAVAKHGCALFVLHCS